MKNIIILLTFFLMFSCESIPNPDKFSYGFSLKGHTNEIYSLIFSSDNKYLLSGGADNKLNIWDIGNKQLYSQLNEASDDILSIAISPNSKYIAAGSLSSKIYIWETETGKLLHQIQGHTKAVNTLIFHPETNKLFSGSADFSIKTWDLDSGKLLNAYTGHLGAIFDLEINAAGSILYSASRDRTIRAWDLEANREKTLLRDHNSPVYNIALTKDENFLISSDKNGKIIIWDTKTDENITPGFLKNPAESETWGLVTLSNPDYVISGAHGSVIRIMDIKLGKTLYSKRNRKSKLWSIAVSPDNRYLAYPGVSNEIQVFSLAEKFWK